MSISKDTELLAKLMVNLALLLAEQIDDGTDWPQMLVERMKADIERAKSNE